MFKVIRKWWKYLTAKLSGSFEERADPKIQLEQAITEAQNQHRRLREQAANVIANQKQGELRLNNKMTELEKLNANARQALIMAADAEKVGNTDKATQYTTAAETIANQLIQVEKDVESLKSLVIEATQASDQAKVAVAQNSRLLQEKLSEKSKLLSQLDQAKMQEEMNSAMAQLNESVGSDVPSLAEVQEKIQARYAKAKATAELTETSVSSRVLEIEQATANVEAQSRLSELRAELGLGGDPRAPGRRAGPAGRATPRLTRSAPSDRPDRARTSVQDDEIVAMDDGVGQRGREVARAAAGDVAERGGVDRHHPAGEHRTVWRADVDSVAGAEAPDDVDHAGREQARPPLDERPPSAVVDGHPTGGRERRTRSTACGRRACGDGRRTWSRPHPRLRHRPARPRGRHWRSPCARPTTTRCGPPPACWPCRHSPGRCHRDRRGWPAAGHRP